MAVIEDNIEEIEKQILDAVGYYEDSVPKQLAALVSDIQDQLKKGRYKNRTGDLRRSIRTKLVDYSISINMLSYGYYQSFGVDGRKRKGAVGLTAGPAAAFGVREGYKFGSRSSSKYVAGIRAKDFYPDDLEEKLIEILLEEE